MADLLIPLPIVQYCDCGGLWLWHAIAQHCDREIRICRTEDKRAFVQYGFKESIQANRATNTLSVYQENTNGVHYRLNIKESFQRWTDVHEPSWPTIEQTGP